MRNPRVGRSCSLAIGFLLLVPRTADAQSVPEGWPHCLPGEIEVVILGTYHMASSRDDIQRDIDNVLSERRQAEILALIDRLTPMAPDRVAVEVAAERQSEVDERYQAYRAGEAELSPNEVEQIGFRLASALDRERVYAIDYRLGIGNDSIGAFYDRHPEARERSEAIWEDVERSSRADDERLARSTVVDYLRWENSEYALRSEGNRAMYAHLLAGEADNYGGADLFARWYERNAKMAHLVARIADPTDRRVLVIVGSGHVRPLRDVFDLSPHFCPASPLPWLGG